MRAHSSTIFVKREKAGSRGLVCEKRRDRARGQGSIGASCYHTGTSGNAETPHTKATSAHTCAVMRVTDHFHARRYMICGGAGSNKAAVTTETVKPFSRVRFDLNLPQWVVPTAIRVHRLCIAWDDGSFVTFIRLLLFTFSHSLVVGTIHPKVCVPDGTNL